MLPYRRLSSDPPADPRGGAAPTDVGARLRESPFVAEVVLDAWARAGLVVRAGATLATHDAQRFLLTDACRVLGPQNGDRDPYGLSGRVDALRELIRQGASVSRDRVRLGAVVYDVEFGFLAIPYASADESGCSPAVR
jgi:hypothetical protein